MRWMKKTVGIPCNKVNILDRGTNLNYFSSYMGL